jgi:diguanylate cyclase (GGDEF)-like protein/PAS domain S-box-containing protein
VMYAQSRIGGLMEVTPDAGDSTESGGGAAEAQFVVAPLALLEGLPDAVVVAARDQRIVFVNGLAEELFGYAREELVGQPVNVLWPERVRELYTHNMERFFATEHPLRFSSEARGRRRDGSEFVGEMSWGIVATTEGPLLFAVGRDVTERRASEARTRAVARLGERALAGSEPRGLATDALELLRTTLPVGSGAVRLGDGAALASFGPPANDPMRLPIGPADELVLACERALTDEEIAVVHAVANILATALSRLRDEAKMRHEAVHDPLTGLANRVLLRDRMETALARSEREGSQTGVFFIDLDNFKRVNDLHGHAIGDAVLVELGARLKTALRPADTVARLGGDEFVAICEKVDEEVALALGQRIQDALSEPISAGRFHGALSASIGIAIGNENPNLLLAHADVALYRAKAEGRGCVQLFQTA